MAIAKGDTVRFRVNGKPVFGIVRTDVQVTATGPMVKVELLPDFQHLTPGTGLVDASAAVADMHAVKVCGCAYLAYRPTWGDREGELFTTGCDFSRRPSRTSTFLPGHDAKAKGFLIKAAGMTSTLENGKSALETARDFGDKIVMAVAKGIDVAREKSAKNTASRMWRNVKETDDRPAVREDQLTDAQRLQRQLGVTDAMMASLARGLTNDLAGYEGSVGGPTGTKVALQGRKLASWGVITDLGCRVMDQPLTAELWGDRVVCTDGEGSYTAHSGHRECKRCGAERDDS